MHAMTEVMHAMMSAHMMTTHVMAAAMMMHLPKDVMHLLFAVMFCKQICANPYCYKRRYMSDINSAIRHLWPRYRRQPFNFARAEVLTHNIRT
jgi:hypothetical protein